MTKLPKRNTKAARAYAESVGMCPDKMQKILARWRRMGATVEEIQRLVAYQEKHGG